MQTKRRNKSQQQLEWNLRCEVVSFFFSSGTLSWKQQSIALSFDSSKKNQFPSSFQRSRFCWVHSEGKFTVYYLGVCCSNNSCGTRSAIANKENFHLQFILGSPLKKSNLWPFAVCKFSRREENSTVNPKPVSGSRIRTNGVFTLGIRRNEVKP